MSLRLSPSTWRLDLDPIWDVLAPFPIHAREHHFLSPAYPVDLSSPIDTAKRYPSSLTATAYASWSQATADAHGTINVAHPIISWDHLRASEGWAGLQHLNVLRGWLSVHPPSDLADDSPEPLLRTELLQGAFFAILPPPDSPQRQTHVPEWHSGNIYSLERPPVQLVRLPVPSARNVNVQGTKYEVIICAPYEIRLFGDPLAREYSSPDPVLTLNFTVSLQFPCSPSPFPETEGLIEGAPLQQIIAHTVAPSIVDGTPFGDAIGIGVQCLDFGRHIQEGQGHWLVLHACLAPTSEHLPPSLSVSLLDQVPIRIAPTQTRIVPLRLDIPSSEGITGRVKQLDIDLTCVPVTSLNNQASLYSPSQSTFVLQAILPLTHVPLWTKEKDDPIQASYFFAKSIPTLFLVKPPMETIRGSQVVPGQLNEPDIGKCRGNEPVLALHGAGVDVLAQSFWPDSLLRQKYAWVVMPQGRTAWGLDWHGPSAVDAFAAISALSRILSSSGSGRWVKWSFHPGTRVVLIGHSNGGQGAWYIATRWPDRVCAVVPAAAYIKSQLYVSWNMSHFAHFADPALRAVLDSSLTPDDNDLFVGNLVGKPMLVLHGGADRNVPPWHAREMVGILRTWDPDADVTYYEEPGRPHWYFEILYNERVQAFLDRVYFSSSSLCSRGEAPSTCHALTNQGHKTTTDFTITVAVPTESGSLNGWQILALTIPGLLGRLRVTTTTDECVSVRTTNVSVFSLGSGAWAATQGVTKKAIILAIDSDNIPIDPNSLVDTILFVRDANTAGQHTKSPWKILPPGEPSKTAIHRLRTPPQRLQAILSTHAPLTLLVPSLLPCPELSAALRIAYVLFLYHALDAKIISIAEVEQPDGVVGIREGNLVVIGCADAPLVQRWVEDGIWSYTNKAWHIGATRFDRPSSAILFCQPHPYDDGSIALFVQFTDVSGLERAVRLFPIRTGVPSPDWLVVDGRADTIGAAGVQGAGVYGWTPLSVYDQDIANKWLWNEHMSWLD